MVMNGPLKIPEKAAGLLASLLEDALLLEFALPSLVLQEGGEAWMGSSDLGGQLHWEKIVGRQQAYYWRLAKETRPFYISQNGDPVRNALAKNARYRRAGLPFSLSQELSGLFLVQSSVGFVKKKDLAVLHRFVEKVCVAASMTLSGVNAATFDNDEEWLFQRLQALLQTAVHASKANGGGVYRIRGAGKKLELIARLNQPLGEDGYNMAKHAGFIEEKAFLDGLSEGGLFWEKSQDPECQNVAAKKSQAERVQAMAALPLRFQGETFGVMTVYRYKNWAFSPEERAVLAMMADLAADIAQTAILFERNLLQARALDTLRRVGQAEIASLDLDKTLRRLARQGGELIEGARKGASVVEVYLVENQRIRLAASSRPNYGSRHGWLSVEKEPDQRMGVVRRCIETRETQLVRDVRQDPDYLPMWKGMGSELTTPILAGKESIGAINAEHQEVNAFDPLLVNVFEALSAQVSVAIQSAKLHAEMREIGGFIGKKTALEWISMVGATWGHNLNRETGTARAKLALLKTEAGHVLNEEQNRLVAEIDAAIERTQGVPVLAPLTREDKLEIIELNGLVREYFSRKWAHSGYSDINLEFIWDDAVAIRVRAGRNWLRRLFEVVAENAVRAMRQVKNKTPHVFRVKTQRRGSLALTYMRDSGTGVPIHLHGKLVDRPIRRKEGAHGAGIGLTIAGAIAQTYGGRFYLNEGVSEGAEFVLELPLAKEELIGDRVD